MAKLFVVAYSSTVVMATLLVQEAASFMNNPTSWATAIATVISALFMGWVSVIAARAAARNAVKPFVEKVAGVAEQVDAIVPVVAGIALHVNSEKQSDQNKIAIKDQEIKLKDEVIEDLKRSRDALAEVNRTILLAKAVSQAAVAGATGMSAAPPVASAPVLKAIEHNTEDTATNTKKIDATVQALKDKA